MTSDDMHWNRPDKVVPVEPPEVKKSAWVQLMTAGALLGVTILLLGGVALLGVAVYKLLEWMIAL